MSSSGGQVALTVRLPQQIKEYWKIGCFGDVVLPARVLISLPINHLNFRVLSRQLDNKQEKTVFQSVPSVKNVVKNI